MTRRVLTRRRWLLAPLPLALIGCTNPPAPKPVVEAPTIEDPKSGKQAVYHMMPTARSWARDLQVLRVANVFLAEYPHLEGKFGGWQVVFVSPSLRKMRAYRWSNQDVGTQIRQGIFAGYIEDWAGPQTNKLPFSPQAILQDSDDVWKIVAEKEAKFIAANKQLFVSYELATTPIVPGLTWQVTFGESQAKPIRRLNLDVGTGRIVATNGKKS